jgi:hypothetical protein
MMKKVGVLLSFSMLLFFPNLALSDCADFGRMTGFKVQDNQTITFYSENKPIAQVKLQDCTVESSSNILLMKSYVCDGDKVTVNGQECTIMALTLSSTQ